MKCSKRISGENVNFSHILYFRIVNLAPTTKLMSTQRLLNSTRGVAAPPTGSLAEVVASLNSACQLIILDCHVATSYYQLAIPTQNIQTCLQNKFWLYVLTSLWMISDLLLQIRSFLTVPCPIFPFRIKLVQLLALLMHFYWIRLLIILKVTIRFKVFPVGCFKFMSLMNMRWHAIKTYRNTPPVRNKNILLI